LYLLKLSFQQSHSFVTSELHQVSLS